MDQSLIQAAAPSLLAWFRENARDLPWRHTRDPYKIWVSEVMLQQTRVAAALGYYARFLEAFPTVEALAAGDEEKLLSLWQGLGYYSRARNLKRAAEAIVNAADAPHIRLPDTHDKADAPQVRFPDTHDEADAPHVCITDTQKADAPQVRFPDTYEAVRALPGIGDYTAGAIASAAFGLPYAAVDGNVLRTVARLCDWHEPVTSPAARRTVARALEAAFPAGEDAYIFNQAWMELGAVVCVPNGEPDCGNCPAASLCLARARGTAGELPVREAKRPRRTEERTVFLLLRDGQAEPGTEGRPNAEEPAGTKVRPGTGERFGTEGRAETRTAVRKRPARGLLAGLWEFPNVEGTLDEAGAASVLDGWGLSAVSWVGRITAKHIFTHVEWHMTCYVIRVSGGTKDPAPDSAGLAPDSAGLVTDSAGLVTDSAGLVTDSAGLVTDGGASEAAFRWIDRRELDQYAIPSAFARFRERAAELLDSAERLNGKDSMARLNGTERLDSAELMDDAGRETVS